MGCHDPTTQRQSAESAKIILAYTWSVIMTCIMWKSWPTSSGTTCRYIKSCKSHPQEDFHFCRTSEKLLSGLGMRPHDVYKYTYTTMPCVHTLLLLTLNFTCMANLMSSMSFLSFEPWYTSKLVSSMLNHPLLTYSRHERMDWRRVGTQFSFK